jgi:hypothetical protein
MNGSRDSSVSIMSGCGLDNWVRQRQENFFSILCVQTSSGAHSVSYPMGTEGPFLGGKVRPGHDADHSPPSSAKVKNEWELYLPSPKSLHGV